MKKAQITMFILVAIVMIILVGAAITYGPGLIAPRAMDAEVPSYISSCLKMTGQNALIELGQQGGYINLPEDHHELSLAYLYDGTNLAPSKEEISIELGNYITQHITDCIDFNELKGYTLIKESTPTTTVLIGKKSMEFILNYDFTLRKGEEELNYDKFQTSEPLALGRIIEMVNQMVADQVENPGFVEIADYYNNNLDITFTAINNDLITSIKDFSYLIDNKPYEFVFAQKYRQV